jgi:hypothetical protein
MQVNFTPSEQQARETQEDKVAVAQELTKLPGLRWKIWIWDKPSNTRGGIYLFDDLASAKSFGDDQLAGIFAALGATNVSIRYFEIDLEPSLANAAPLGALTMT